MNKNVLRDLPVPSLENYRGARISSFLHILKQQVIKRMAGDGHIRRAQQRQCVMKTVQLYSILSCPTILSYCLHPLFSLSHIASNHLFYSLRSFKLKCNLGTQYNVRSGFQEIYSSQYGLQKQIVRTHCSHEKLQELQK